MEDTDLKWRKASYSSNGGGNCVEVADHHNTVLIRDSKHREAGHLTVTADAWRSFVTDIKTGRMA